MKKLIPILIALFTVAGAAAQNNICHYYDNGELKEEAYATSDVDAKVITYYENGRIKSERYLRDNAPHGVWLAYDEKGNVTAIRQYENGLKAGVWTIKLPDSDVRYVKRYVNGLLVKSEKLDGFGNTLASK